MGWSIHLHLISAIAWIGGAVFMFVLGIFMRDKTAQKEVYPRIGPLFGYYQVVALALLLATGISMISQNGLLTLLISGSTNEIVLTLQKKLLLVGFVIVLTIIHFIIAYKTNGKDRTFLQNFISRGSSLLIFFINLWILHYAIIIRHYL
jgi:putative copper export protein